MKQILNLAYGSNLWRARIAARVNIATVYGTLVMPGWGLRFHKRGSDGSGKCNLIQSPQETAYGIVYGYSPEDKIKLDKIEGVGQGYIDAPIALDAFDLSATSLRGDETVLAYLAVESHIDESLIPYDWYHGFVRKGAEQCGFPGHYLAHIESFAQQRDTNEVRRKENLAILGSG